MDFFKKILSVEENKKLLVIDNLSYFDNQEKDFNEIYEIVTKIQCNIHIISKKIYPEKNLFLNPDKIKEINNFFKNNKNFDIIIDIHSDYIQQLSIFSLLFNKTNTYIIKINDNYKKEMIYNIKKFTKNIKLSKNYLFITK